MSKDIGAAGRPSVVTNDVKEVVEKGSEQRLRNAVEEETGRRVSARTMRRVRRRLHYYGRAQGSSPRLVP